MSLGGQPPLPARASRRAVGAPRRFGRFAIHGIVRALLPRDAASDAHITAKPGVIVFGENDRGHGGRSWCGRAAGHEEAGIAGAARAGGPHTRPCESWRAVQAVPNWRIRAPGSAGACEILPADPAHPLPGTAAGVGTEG